MGKKEKEFIIITFELSTVKRVLLVDMGVGTLSYYGIKLVSGNMIIDLLGSLIITEGLKKAHKIKTSLKVKDDRIKIFL